MKKKFLLIIAVLAGMITSSCNMDLPPEGVIMEDEALETVADALKYRNGFYTGFRGLTTSGFFSYPEIQADMFNGIIINGNRIGTIANGDVLASDSDIAGYWLACFGRVASINFFLNNIEPLQAKVNENGDPDQILAVNRYIGEAHFFRAYYYACMMDRWCQVYSPEIGDTPGLGLPIVTVYDPTPDRSRYPSRSTLNETIKFINDDIQIALDAILAYEEVDNGNCKYMAPYISSYAIRALQARIALWLGQWEQARTYANEVINSGLFPLATGNAYVNMWTTDSGTEIIFQPYEDTDELSGAYGGTWLTKWSDKVDYIPTPTLVNELMAAGKNFLGQFIDVRYSAFVEVRTLNIVGTDVKCPCFTKFPGNPELQLTSEVNLMNKAKPFRTSELYLIVAEASYNLNDEEAASAALNTLLKARYRNSNAIKEYTGIDLRDEIRRQRGIELVGEGFRISDLRRWGLGFSRAGDGSYEDYPDVDGILTHAGLEVVYQPNDHRYTWPIPSDELQCNPQMAGQQNPGY